MIDFKARKLCKLVPKLTKFGAPLYISFQFDIVSAWLSLKTPVFEKFPTNMISAKKTKICFSIQIIFLSLTLIGANQIYLNEWTMLIPKVYR